MIKKEEKVLESRDGTTYFVTENSLGLPKDVMGQAIAKLGLEIVLVAREDKEEKQLYGPIEIVITYDEILNQVNARLFPQFEDYVIRHCGITPKEDVDVRRVHHDSSRGGTYLALVSMRSLKLGNWTHKKGSRLCLTVKYDRLPG